MQTVPFTFPENQILDPPYDTPERGTWGRKIIRDSFLHTSLDFSSGPALSTHQQIPSREPDVAPAADDDDAPFSSLLSFFSSSSAAAQVAAA